MAGASVSPQGFSAIGARVCFMQRRGIPLVENYKKTSEKSDVFCLVEIRGFLLSYGSKQNVFS